MIDEDGELLGDLISPGPGHLPETRLWVAVILQALSDAQTVSTRMAGDRRWLDEGQSFAAVCDLAGLEPWWVRSRWRAMPEERILRKGRGKCKS